MLSGAVIRRHTEMAQWIWEETQSTQCSPTLVISALSSTWLHFLLCLIHKSTHVCISPDIVLMYGISLIELHKLSINMLVLLWREQWTLFNRWLTLVVELWQLRHCSDEGEEQQPLALAVARVGVVEGRGVVEVQMNWQRTHQSCKWEEGITSIKMNIKTHMKAYGTNPRWYT